MTLWQSVNDKGVYEGIITLFEARIRLAKSMRLPIPKVVLRFVPIKQEEPAWLRIVCGSE